MGNKLLGANLHQQGLLYIVQVAAKKDSLEEKNINNNCRGESEIIEEGLESNQKHDAKDIENRYELHVSRSLFIEPEEINCEILEKSRVEDGGRLKLVGLYENSIECVLEVASVYEDQDLNISIESITHSIKEELSSEISESDSSITRDTIIVGDLRMKVQGLREPVERSLLKNLFGSQSIESKVNNLSLMEFLRDITINEFHTISLTKSQEVKEFIAQANQKNQNGRKVVYKRVEFNYKWNYFEVIECLSQLKSANYLKQIESLVLNSCNFFTFSQKIEEKQKQQFRQLLSYFKEAKEVVLGSFFASYAQQKIKNCLISIIFESLPNATLIDLSSNVISNFNDDSIIEQPSEPQQFVEDDEEEQKKQNDMNIEQIDNSLSENSCLNVRVLCLNSNRIQSASSVASFLNNSKLQKVERLYLISNLIKDFIFTQEQFQLKNLTYLNLQANNLELSSLDSLFSLKSLNNLEQLILKKNKIKFLISEETICELVNLTYLDLSQNNFESDSINYLLKSSNLTKLSELNLSQNLNRIHLLDFSQLPSLKTVNLSKTLAQQLIFTPQLEAESLALEKNDSQKEDPKPQFGWQCINQPNNRNKQFVNLSTFPPLIESLDLSDNQIGLNESQSSQLLNLKPKDFFSRLTHLNLSHNQIIDPTLFITCIPSLVLLDLSHNLISSLKNGIYLPNIHSLDLSYNLIKDSSPIFHGLSESKRINSLNLSNNKISTILLPSPEIPSKVLSLRELDLSFNCIQDDQSIELFRSLVFSNLISLTLAFNQISTPVKENNLKKLHKLLLSSNQLSDTGFNELMNCEFQCLSILDLDKNQVQNIPATKLTFSLFHAKFPKLVSLVLSNNKLNHFDIVYAISIFNSLHNISFNNNEIDIFSDKESQTIDTSIKSSSISQVQKLEYRGGQVQSQLAQQMLSEVLFSQHINLSNNQISSLNPLSHENLTQLNLSDNSLTSEAAHTIFYSPLHSLLILELSHNKIESLFEDYSKVQLTNLEALQCANNQISSAQSNFILQSNCLPKLRVLNLRKNKINVPVAPNSQINCPNLQSLILQSNLLTTEGAMNLFSAHSCSLKTLDLSFNVIKSELILSNVQLKELKTLDISGNLLGDKGFEQIVKSSELPKLYFLNLGNNKIRSFPELFTLPSLCELNISENQVAGIYEKMSHWLEWGFFCKIIT